MTDYETTSTSSSPFHRGEQRVQQRMGVRDAMERFGRQVIRDHMPEQHRDFYTSLPFVFAGHADDLNRPWASILFDRPGFILSPDNRRLSIHTQPVAGDPLTGALVKGRRLGLLGIELSSRRRNRLSGRITRVHPTGIELAVDQTFGNCPQYIQNRELHYIDSGIQPEQSMIELTQFDQEAVELISSGDTFFVASYAADGTGRACEGADVSHRGGKPGFIRIDDSRHLTIPDYLGNNHFNTLGNFVETPKAGLLFIDFANGHLLTVTGSVEILWDSPETRYFAGAERLWRFRIERGRWLKNALPFRWIFREYSPNTLLTGSWTEAQAARRAERLRNSWQPYRVIKITNESNDVKSFYLQPPDGQKPTFQAGQYLTLKADIDGKEQIRTYTVSSAPGDPLLRISVKHERGNRDKPEGRFSSYLHRHMETGMSVSAKAPAGTFTLPADHNQQPAVLISAGIGITPMLAMARHTWQEGIRTRRRRPVIFISSVRNARQRAFYRELNQLAADSDGQIQVYWALSQPETGSKTSDYDHIGRIDKNWLQSLLPATYFDVFLCGPDGFMQSQYNHLRELGVPDRRIFAETFGPSSFKRDVNQTTDHFTGAPPATEAIVTFTESNLELAWKTQDGTLLEFAEAHGLNPNSGCRSGRCGSCKVKLIKGRVSYIQAIDLPLESNEILLCCSIPAKEKEQQTALHIAL